MNVSENMLDGREGNSDFLEEYNREIDKAEAEFDKGHFLTHEEVEKLFAERREVRKY